MLTITNPTPPVTRFEDLKQGDLFAIDPQPGSVFMKVATNDGHGFDAIWVHDAETEKWSLGSPVGALCYMSASQRVTPLVIEAS